jgi:antitoxin component YwqK of YwqJK toxin-antitoxin module
MFIDDFLLPDILQYVLNLYIDHRKDIHIIQKFTNKFMFDLKPFINVNTLYESDGSVIKVEFIWIDDMQYKYISYYENGNKKNEWFYENGVINGTKKIWYKSGKIKCQINYVNGKKRGLYLQFNEKGKVIKRKNYINEYVAAVSH